MKRHPLELLAPAKNKECAFAAINFGADAIYTGAPLFGARKNASNSLEDISQMVQYAHKFFAKVYVTINTIISDDEIDKVQKLLFELYDIGVDGIIIQDFGIFELKLPPFKIFASTQCDIRDADKVKFFEDIGLDRVILARELTLEKIKEICANTNIEVETFVHGALCVCYSGQCYLSCASGKRSANRGECAQPCRKKYDLIDKEGKIYSKGRHLLSLKDLCLINHLEDLINAGVTSFKIEGRLKDENYVKNVVAAYNKALLGKSRVSSGRVFYDFEPDINKSFNRGFCKYFFTDDKEEIFNFDTPKSIGEFVGTVESFGNNFFDIKTNKILSAQDGLFFPPDEGAMINSVEKTGNITRVYPNKMPKVKKGQKVFRNFDSAYEKLLINSKTKRKIKADIKVYYDRVEAFDEDGISAVLEFESNDCAKDMLKMKQIFENQFKKTGESDFYIDKIMLETQNMPFLRIAQVNSIRRELLEKLMNNRVLKYNNRSEAKICPAKFPFKNNDYRLNVHNKKAREFYKKCGVNCAQESFEKLHQHDAELMRTKHCLRRAFNMCKKTSKEPDKELFLVDEKGNKLRLLFDCKNCEMIIKE